MKRWFFTFGTDPAFPYGIHNYVEVHAETEDEACERFKEKHPNRPGSTLVNCAFIYREDAWESVRREFYNGRTPAEIIE